MDKSRRTFVLLIVVAAMLAACGSGGDDGSPSTTEPPAPSTTAEPDGTDAPEIEGAVLDRVAGDICSSIDTWSSAIAAAYDATPAALADADSTESARAVVVDWMASMSAHTESLVAELREVDLEDAESLEPFTADLAERFEGLDAIVDAHESRAAEITTSAPETFRAEVSALVEEFNTALTDVLTLFDDLNASYPSGDLQAALASACELDPLEADGAEGAAPTTAPETTVSGED